MTFGELKQRVYDKLGLTAEETMVESMVNEALQEVATAAPWRFLMEQEDQLWTSSQTLYTTGARVGYVIELHDSSGNPLDIVDRQLFKDLYRGDTSTAASPSVAFLNGTSSSGTPVSFQVWPTPASNSTGKRLFLRRIAELTTTADVPEIPTQWQYLIVDGALARFAGHESDTQLQEIKTEFEAGLQKMRQTEPVVNLP